MTPNPTPTRLPTIARGFTPARAQKWIVAAALITAATYGFRRVVEPELATSGARAAGAGGTPPEPLGVWAISWGAAFLFLSVISLGAPEAAAAMAILATTAMLLRNGNSIASDLTSIEQGNQASGAGASVGAAIDPFAGHNTAGGPVDVAPGAAATPHPQSNVQIIEQTAAAVQA